MRLFSNSTGRLDVLWQHICDGGVATCVHGINDSLKLTQPRRGSVCCSCSGYDGFCAWVDSQNHHSKMCSAAHAGHEHTHMQMSQTGCKCAEAG